MCKKLANAYGMNLQEQIVNMELIKNHLGTITKSEIMENILGISQTTVQRTLTDLVKEGKIIKIGGGRYTKYTCNWDKED